MTVQPRDETVGFVLALIAHDRMKEPMVELAHEHRALLSRLRLVATSTTGTRLREALALPVELAASGPSGGDLQIGARIVGGGVDALVFLRDPLSAHPHEPDIQALLKVCDVHDVALATNVASARILLTALA